MNSYVRPKVADYVQRLQEQLNGIGAKAEVNILRSDAGLMTTREAARNPIYGVLSGPSGGVAGALFVARKAGFDDILTFDMGGTSTDVSLCQDGQPTIGRETSIGHFRIKVPSVNVHTVGAGGGSIAHVPELTKALRVGPQSAGAEPGPAAYGQGRRRADRHRRERRARPPAAAAARRRDGARRRRGAGRGAEGRGRDGARFGRAGRGGDPRDRQREHGGRAAARLRSARPRPARLRARRLRRRRAAARERPGEADGLVPRDRPARAGPSLRDRRPRRRLPRRVRADATSGSSPTPSGGEVAEILEASASGRRRGSRARASRRRHSGWPTPQTCATTGRATRSRWRSSRTRCGTAGSATWRSGSTSLHEQLYGFRMPGTASEIVNLRAVGFGDVPKPELPVGEPGSARCVRSRRRRARGDLRRRARRDEDLRPLQARSPGRSSTARRS